MSRLVLAAVIGLVGMAGVWADDKEDAVKKELEKFQGEWKMVGQDSITVKFKGDDYEFSEGGPEKGKMKFNPSTKPAQVDVDIKEGTDAGKKQVGIYEFKGDDKVKFCFATAGKTDRPSKFEAAEDGSVFVFEFERVKK